MDMIFQFDGMPLPTFVINADFTVLQSSKEAGKLFGTVESLTQVIDEGSLKKAEMLLQSSNGKIKGELNFVTKAGELLLVNLFGNWMDESNLLLVLVPQEDNIERISQQLRNLQKRLRETDYELFQEKELTMQLLERVHMLSAPCIQLDRRQVLIPLFGDITAEKVDAFGENLLASIHSSHAEEIIIDFTAVDQIEAEGLTKWDGLVQSLNIMGMHCVITGINPFHAKQLHLLDSHISMRFAPSLLEVLSANHDNRF